MANLESRIAELEKKAGTANDENPLFVHFVALGDDEPSPIARICLGNREWVLQDGETEEAFKARVLSSAKALPKDPQSMRVFTCFSKGD